MGRGTWRTSAPGPSSRPRGASASASSARVIASARPVARAYRPRHLGHVNMPCLVTIEVTSERAPEQKLKRRTAKIRVFSNEESSERPPAPCWPRSANAGMRDQHKSEFPDSRLHNFSIRFSATSSETPALPPGQMPGAEGKRFRHPPPFAHPVPAVPGRAAHSPVPRPFRCSFPRRWPWRVSCAACR